MRRLGQLLAKLAEKGCLAIFVCMLGGFVLYIVIYSAWLVWFLLNLIFGN